MVTGPTRRTSASARATASASRKSTSTAARWSCSTTSRPFTDVRARQAVAYALSGTEINDKFYNGAGTPAKGIFGSASPLANNQLSTPENNADKAKELFDQVTKNGTKPLQFTYITPAAPTTVDVARFIQQKLSAYRGVEDPAGGHRHLHPHGPQGRRRLDRGGRKRQWIDDPEPGIYDLLHGGPAAFGNSAGYDNPEVNKALEAARSTTDTADRRDAYTRVQTQLNEDVPFWVYQEAVSAALFTPKVTGLQLFNDGLVRWELIGLHK
ncbi:ABC transporter substrate-binding protein [Yinghuangia aomiensis]